jgi:hypothetical protein
MHFLKDKNIFEHTYFKWVADKRWTFK